MDQLNLLKDYVTTMQREIASKNQQIRTLIVENEKLMDENSILQTREPSMTPSVSQSVSQIGKQPCYDCMQVKREFIEIQGLCQQLQDKYDKLEQQKNAQTSKNSSTYQSTVRVLTASNCHECPKLRNEIEILKRANHSKSLQSPTYISSLNGACSNCERYKSEIRSKQQTVASLKRQLSQYNERITSLCVQLERLEQMGNIQQQQKSSSLHHDLERIAYLNGQVEQYMALVNNLRSEIKALSIESDNRIRYIRQLESRPRQIQYVEKELSSDIRESIRSLKTQIGELSNDNIQLRRQNKNLREDMKTLEYKLLMNQQNQQQHHCMMGQTAVHPENNSRNGRHFRKDRSPTEASHSPFEQPNSKSTLNFNRGAESQQFAKSKKKTNEYEELQRKIMRLQMENQHLKTAYYTES